MDDHGQPAQQPGTSTGQPDAGAASTWPASRDSSTDYVKRDEFERRVGQLEQSRDDAVTVTAPEPDPEITAATAAAVGQPDPNLYSGDNNPPEGAVDPHGRSDGTGLATEGNEPVAKEHKGFFRGF